MIRLLLCALLLSLALPAAANEAVIRQVMEAKLGSGVKVEGVQPSPIPGVFEVRFRSERGPQIVYTDATATHIFVGRLYEAKTDRNLTEERMQKLTAIKFSELPLERAIKQVRGDGKRVLATFEDPNCGYCKRLAKDLLKLDNVTIYTLSLIHISEPTRPY